MQLFNFLNLKCNCSRANFWNNEISRHSIIRWKQSDIFRGKCVEHLSGCLSYSHTFLSCSFFLLDIVFLWKLMPGTKSHILACRLMYNAALAWEEQKSRYIMHNVPIIRYRAIALTSRWLIENPYVSVTEYRHWKHQHRSDRGGHAHNQRGSEGPAQTGGTDDQHQGGEGRGHGRQQEWIDDNDGLNRHVINIFIFVSPCKKNWK